MKDCILKNETSIIKKHLIMLETLLRLRPASFTLLISYMVYVLAEFICKDRRLCLYESVKVLFYTWLAVSAILFIVQPVLRAQLCEHTNVCHLLS